LPPPVDDPRDAVGPLQKPGYSEANRAGPEPGSSENPLPAGLGPGPAGSFTDPIYEDFRDYGHPYGGLEAKNIEDEVRRQLHDAALARGRRPHDIIYPDEPVASDEAETSSYDEDDDEYTAAGRREGGAGEARNGGGASGAGQKGLPMENTADARILQDLKRHKVDAAGVASGGSDPLRQDWRQDLFGREGGVGGSSAADLAAMADNDIVRAREEQRLLEEALLGGGEGGGASGAPARKLDGGEGAVDDPPPPPPEEETMQEDVI
jgi:hypothetical protein